MQNSTSNNSVDTIRLDKFVYGCGATTDADLVHLDMQKRCTCTVPGVLSTSAAAQPDDGLRVDVAPIQLANLVAFLSRRMVDTPYGKLVYVGNGKTETFVLLNEAIRTRESGVFLAVTPPRPSLLKYSLVRHFRITQIQQNHEVFSDMLDRVAQPGDLIVFDMESDDAAGILPSIDNALAKKSDVVLFNVCDPEFPNCARLWSMCKANEILETIEFSHSYDDAPLDGGAIGFVRLCRQESL
jgi:hypothetical protein